MGADSALSETHLKPLDPGTGLFSEPVAEQEDIPTPKLFWDVVQKQQTHPESSPTPSGNDQHFYNMDYDFSEALQLPMVDGPVAALASPSATLSGDIAEGLKAEDKNLELSMHKTHQAAAWAIKEATAASFFNHTSFLWLQQMQLRIPPHEAWLHQDVSKLIAAAQFSVDATLNSTKYASKALSLAVTSRRVLWLRQWHADTRSKWRLASAPYSGGTLFGEALEPSTLRRIITHCPTTTGPFRLMTLTFPNSRGTFPKDLTISRTDPDLVINPGNNLRPGVPFVEQEVILSIEPSDCQTNPPISGCWDRFAT